MAGVTDTDYEATLAVADTIGASGGTNTIISNGVFQRDIYNLLSSIRTKFNLLNAKLDADGGVTDTDFAATWNLPTLESQNVFLNGFNQGALVAYTRLIETNFEAVTAKLDADGGVESTDYASTLNFALSAHLTANGMDQRGLINSLQTIITGFNLLLAKLDDDEGEE